LTPQYLLNQLNWNQSQTEIEIGYDELYLIEGIEQFQSLDFVPQLQDIPEDNHRSQIGDEILKVNEVNTSLSLEILVLPIVVSSNMEGNVERREINTSQQRSPSNSSSSSSSSNPPTPPSPPIQNLENLVPMAQPQRLLNIVPFPYFYGRLGDDPDAYVDRFLIVATANELPQAKYLTSFPGNLVGNARE
jgi:hypothetical protein